MPDSTPSPSGAHARICPSCRSDAIIALGRLLASSHGIRSQYRCQACATEFWLHAERRVGRTDRRAPS